MIKSIVFIIFLFWANNPNAASYDDVPEAAITVIERYIQILKVFLPFTDTYESAAREAIDFLTTGVLHNRKAYDITALRPWFDGEKEKYVHLIQLSAKTWNKIEIPAGNGLWRAHNDEVQRIYIEAFHEPTIVGDSAVPGDAYYARNPENPAQQILIVPVNHDFPLELYPKPLRDAIKNCDVIVFENADPTGKKFISQDEVTRIKTLVTDSLKDLKDDGMVRRNSFLFDRQAWTESKLFSGSQRKLLSLLTQPFHDASILDLSWVHPQGVREIIQRFLAHFIYSKGIEGQMERHFTLSEKPVLSLEHLHAYLQTDESAFSENPRKEEVTQEDLEAVQKTITDYQVFTEQTPQQRLEEGKRSVRIFNAVRGTPFIQVVFGDAERLVRRTRNWVRPFINITQQYPNQSIAVLVGTGHFYNNVKQFRQVGFLTLLTRFGFTFRSFAEGPFI